MVSIRSLLALSLATGAALGAAVQPDGPTYDEMAATALEFKNADLVPTVIPQEYFSLSGALQLTYNATNQSVGELGSIASPQSVAQPPAWTLNYTAEVAKQQVFWSQLFTAVLFDAGYPGDDLNNTVGAHYLANNMTIMDGTLYNMSSPVISYIPPSANNGTGPHRYVGLVFAQGPDFAPIANFTMDPATFSLTDYVQQTKLGRVVAASYYILQNGTTSATLEPQPEATQAVDPQEIAAMASSISASIISRPTLAQFVQTSGAASSHGAAFAALAIAASIAAGCTLVL